MKKVFLLSSLVASIILFGDCFVKEMSLNQLISTAGIGTITAILGFWLQFEETAGYFFEKKSVGLASTRDKKDDVGSPNRLIR
jgi:hypothetical protein